VARAPAARGSFERGGGAAFAGLDAAFIERVTATNCARLYGLV
jgi:hypothetical protein